MPADDLPMALWILLGAILLILLFVLFGQWVLGGRMRRIEEKLGRNVRAETLHEEVGGRRKEQSPEQKRLFQEFMMEDPSRAALTKKEQFAAFRKWRDEKGLNWSKRKGDA